MSAAARQGGTCVSGPGGNLAVIAIKPASTTAPAATPTWRYITPQDVLYGSGFNGNLVLSGTVAGSITALAANSCGDAVTAAISGATVSMGVVATPSADPGPGLLWQAWVSSAGNVSVRYCNVTTGPITPSAATFNIRVVQ